MVSFPRRDCVAIKLCFFVEKNGLLKLRIINFFEILGVKPFLKMSIFSRFANCDTVSKAGIQETNELDYPVELGNDKDEESVMLHPLSFPRRRESRNSEKLI
jgi:hypothetical protein